ncbi:MAG: membrane protein insertase YidC [Geminicoccaceae bacterium]
MPEQRNLILAIALSVGIIFAFQFFYELPRQQALLEQQEQAEARSASQPRRPQTAETPSRAPGDTEVGAPEIAPVETERVGIDNGRLHGSVALTGGRFDDITLADYRVRANPNSPEITLLSPVGSTAPYFAEFGWVAQGGNTAVPDSDTVWSADTEELTANDPMRMSWDNGEGLTFQRSVTLDENYLFTLERSVINNSDETITLYPYGLISRWGTPETLGFWILHEGPIGVLEEQLTEVDYSDLQDDGEIQIESQGGWLGLTDKYWLTSLITDAEITATFRHTNPSGQDRYQTDYLGRGIDVAPGASIEITDRFFAGAKEVKLLDQYSEAYDIPLFDRAVDFGWFYFLTRPLFWLISNFFALTGNYGVAILLLTLVVKLLFFPLANTAYRSMSAMKKLQPEMVKLRERYGEDRTRMQQELMKLYKKEKVNPAAGCLPILIQIPVFFALYKVLFVSIEMRHAPFFGWIRDLSAPDPTSMFNLFGLIPWDPPTFLMIGVWPLLMGITMYLQTKLNPAPADPMQARIMLMLPLIFIFLFATFPAGLVVYWTWNNVLSIAQQWLIMRKMGVSVS